MHHKVIVIGNLGRDPEKRYTQEGSPVTSFPVASNSSYKDRDGNKKTKTTWFRCSAWNKFADTCEKYLKKGSKVYMEGELIADTNGSPKVFKRSDNTFGSSFELKITKILFLDGKQDTDMQQEEEDYKDDEIPF